MTAPQRRVGLHRDVLYELDTLTRIRASATWLEAHLPDLHDLAYAPNSGGGEDRVQTSGERDLSDDLGRPARHAWHTIHQALRAALIEVQRAEYATGEQFTAGRLPEPDRPGRDTSLPPHQRKQLNAAARRRQDRGEYAPTPLGKKPQR